MDSDTVDADAAFDLAVDALNRHDEAAALPRVAAAAARFDTAPLWQLTGLLHRGLDAMPAAEAALARAAALAPADARIAHARARVALEAGWPSLALFEAARRLAPGNPEIALGIAHAQAADGDLADAIRGLDERLAADPGWLPGHELAARLRCLAGERDRFGLSFERALAERPRDVALWQWYISLLIQADRFGDALVAVAAARRQSGGGAALDECEAICLSELGDHQAAGALFGRLRPADTGGAVRHGRHLLRTGQVEAVELLLLPLADRPDGDLVWPYLGTAWRLLGDPRHAWLEGDDGLVGVYDLDLDAAPLADVLRGLHHVSHRHLDQSVRGGTQTLGMLFRRQEPVLQSLRVIIDAAVASHVAALPAARDGHPTLGRPRPARVRYSGAWSVRLAGGGFHANHIHSEGWLSSALYVALPDAPGDAPAGWLALGEPDAALGLDLAPVRLIEPRVGRLVLFPSTMWHGTRPFAHGERMTVAFDVAGAA